MMPASSAKACSTRSTSSALQRKPPTRGVTRFCMGAAWRQAPEGREFENVLEMVRGVSALGIEVCCTLGMLTREQAGRLKQAGLTAYNHNLDTSPEFYGSIITTRVYDDRLKTLAAVRDAGITVCSGGILGMGERAAGSRGPLAAVGLARSASGKRAHQHAGACARYAAGRRMPTLIRSRWCALSPPRAS